MRKSDCERAKKDCWFLVLRECNLETASVLNYWWRKENNIYITCHKLFFKIHTLLTLFEYKYVFYQTIYKQNMEMTKILNFGILATIMFSKSERLS